MNLFRISAIVLILAAIAVGVVCLRRYNWNYAYRTNRIYDEYRKVKLQYIRNRLELARRKSPQHLLRTLKNTKLEANN